MSNKPSKINAHSVTTHSLRGKVLRSMQLWKRHPISALMRLLSTICMVVTMLDLSLLSHQLAQGFDQFFFVLSGHFFHDGNLNNFTNMAGVQHFF